MPGDSKDKAVGRRAKGVMSLKEEQRSVMARMDEELDRRATAMPINQSMFVPRARHFTCLTTRVLAPNVTVPCFMRPIRSPCRTPASEIARMRG